MTRLALLTLLAVGFAATATAQSDPMTAPADTVAADSVEVIQPDPERARAIYREGLELYRAENLEGALLKYEEALLYNDSYSPAGLGLAQVLTRQGRLEDARNAFETAVAMARASEASNAAEIRGAAQRGLDQVTAALEQRAANAAAQDQANAAQATANKVTEATQIIGANDLSFEQATEGFALLEQARMEGYDPDLVAFYYAKALNAMERGADAIPYAQTAIDNADPTADNSAYYIQLGIAHMGAGNADDARAAFGAITEGQAWHSWVAHYMTKVDEMEAGG